MPLVCAVDDCPQWPTWVLMDSPIVQEELGLRSERLEFYDIDHAQWVSCSPSYPHDVKKDCHLLLRCPGIICTNFDSYLSHATEKPIHMRTNMAGERSVIRDQLRQRKASSRISIINLSDDEVEIVERICPTPLKRRLSDYDDDSRPSQCARVFSPSSSPSLSSPITSWSPSNSARSPSLPLLSLPPCSPPRCKEILVPPSTKPWPNGMFTVDMARAFRKVDLMTLKQRYPTLPSRLAFVFKREIRSNTYHDQLRLWKQATEDQCQASISAGRTEAGLWVMFHKVAKA